MKILTQVGSKDRFLEMFQRVNKVRLNESITGSAMENGNLAKSAFDELVNGTLKIQQTNSESNGNETFVEIVGGDEDGNIVTFKFRVTSTQGDQDGVVSVDSATLINFKIKSQGFSGEMPEGENTIKQLNAERGQEMIDVVSEYVQGDEGEAPEEIEDDSLYEDAVKLIDKVPYKCGTERMQTNAAYADEKPTNPDVRVHSDELSKFISEMQEYVPEGEGEGQPAPKGKKNVPEPEIDAEEDPEGDPMGLPPEYDEKDIPNPDAEIDNNPDVDSPTVTEPEEVSPEKEEIIMQAYDNLISRGVTAPTTNQILAEIERMNPTPKPEEKPDPDNHMAAGKKRVYPQVADKFLAETDYPEEMGIAKEIKTSTNYPKPKKKHRVKKLKVKTGMSESEELEPEENPEETPNDGMNLEPQGDEIAQLAQDKEEQGEILQGGKGDGKSPLEFDPEQIIKGLEVEKEHTDDPLAAIEIVLDHLTEDPEYYTEKDTPEASAQFGAAKDAGEEQGDDDSEMTDVLLGYKPHNVGDEDELGEAIVGAAGATSAVGSNPTEDENVANADNLKKYQEYQKKDFDSLNDTQKEEYFGLWNKFKDKK